MTLDLKYKDIRPYEGEEIAEGAKRLENSAEFLNLFSSIGHIPVKDIQTCLHGITTKKDFQMKFFGPMTKAIMDKTTAGVTVTGMENIRNDKSYLFITNHRDIILDSAMLNVLLINNSNKYCRAAIGSNLFVNEWATDMIKLSSCFTIERNLPMRKMLRSSIIRSQYMREIIQEGEDSIWIAQKEGRTKDGDDRVQQSLIKMLEMSGKGSFFDNIKELNLTPISISYEIEPCDFLKIDEHYKKAFSDYKKTPELDMISMTTRMLCAKGRIHYHISPITNEELTKVSEAEEMCDKYAALTKLIEYKIQNNYKLWPNNYIAYDLLFSVNKFADKYTEEEHAQFTSMIKQKVDRLEGNASTLSKLLLEIYANPVKNKLELAK